MFDEDDLLPISALQHLIFCQRQCALIHLEGLWAENRLTVEGQQLHRKVHTPTKDTRVDVRIARGLQLRSLRLGLVGKADVVEFQRTAAGSAEGAPTPAAFQLSGFGLCRPVPVEFKRGKPKPDGSDCVQLCAQALCLEEMLGCPVPAGALFYGKTRRRLEVPFTPELRRQTEQAASQLHELFRSRHTPAVERLPKCRSCSLLHLCLPEVTASTATAGRFVRRVLWDAQPTAPVEDADP